MPFRTACLATALAASTMLVCVAPARADDAAEIRAVIDGLYASISGPVGAERDFDALRDAMMPDAVMGAVGPGPNGTGSGRLFSVEDYIQRSGAQLVERGFTERGTRTEVDIYGELAHVRSAYEGIAGDTGEVFVTGVNYITLFRINGDWKVASLLWRAADEAWPVEAAFD